MSTRLAGLMVNRNGAKEMQNFIPSLRLTGKVRRYFLNENLK